MRTRRSNSPARRSSVKKTTTNSTYGIEGADGKVVPAVPMGEDPPYELSVWPMYGKLVIDVIHKTLRAWWGVLRAITTLRWYHIVLPPLALYHLAAAWFYNFWQLAPRLERQGPKDFFNRWVAVKEVPSAADLELLPAVNHPEGKVWMPLITREMAMAGRGIGVRGLTTLQHWYMFTLVTSQLVLFSTWRILQYIFNFGRYKRSTSWDPKDTYLCFVNTSMCSWYVKDEGGDETKGSFTFYNLDMFWRQTQILRAAKTQFLADHTTREITKCIIITAADPSQGTESRTIVTTDALEISQMAIHVGATGTHAQVHWWANGVNEIKQWPLAHKSSLWTQLFNWNALNQSFFFLHGEYNNDNELLIHNMQQGMPLHADIPKIITEWEGSKLHSMTRKARPLLKEYFNGINKPVSSTEMNTLLCATMFHSADHYYLDKYSAVAGLNPILKSDNTTMRLSIVGGYNYLFPKFKVSQFKDTDPACMIMYKCALEYEPELAKGLLTIGIAI